MSGTINPKIEESWKNVLASEFEKDYFIKLKEFLLAERMRNVVFPQGSLIFNAFDSTPFDKVKVIILGQDPYHGAGQAHGLCFSVPKGVMPPPSLKNIFKELQTDVGMSLPTHGELTSWAAQGVFLLNAVLTVRANQAASHQKKGWEYFTDAAIRALSEKRDHLVFILWGSYAQAKQGLIDTSKHLILKTVHPSPLSAYGGFFGCRHFSQANAFLAQHGIEPIDWQI